MRHVFFVAVLTAWPVAARAQVFNLGSSKTLDRKIAGRVVDYTHNEGCDRRLYSPILARKRDLYVYLPPGYDPRNAYPVILYLHLSAADEHTITGSTWLIELDRLITEGAVPPTILACPDGLYEGENRYRDPHSFFVNGCGGRFEDHLVREVVPFLTRNYSVRPEREAHAVLGISAGGFGGMALALKHRDVFGASATLSSPLNMRYSTACEGYSGEFDPASYRWNDRYDPDQLVAKFYFGLQRARARQFLGPVFGCAPDVETQIRANNPADLLFSTDLRPGELALYVNFGDKDNYHFDAQGRSFVWLAATRGVDVALDVDPEGKHNLRYFRVNHERAFRWLGARLLPPTPAGGRAP